MASHKVIWTIKELTEVLRERQLNEFDANFGVSGRRGNGKSTFLFKIFNSYKKDGFQPNKHQVYSQKDVIELLSNQKFGFCWDDEAINSGYKRDFNKTGQKKLIKIITNYRDNFNIYASALPFFYSLDKDLRELMFMHIHIVERGFAVILLPVADQIHSSDPWDTKNNIKTEEKEFKLMKKNSNHKFRYNKLSTFAGYLYFGPMTKKQKRKYLELKAEKRKKAFEGDSDIVDGEVSFIQKLYNLLIEKKLSKEGLMQTCLIEGRKYSVVTNTLNKMLTDNGIEHTLRYYLPQSNEEERQKAIKIEKKKQWHRDYAKKKYRELKKSGTLPWQIERDEKKKAKELEKQKTETIIKQEDINKI